MKGRLVFLCAVLALLAKVAAAEDQRRWFVVATSCHSLAPVLQVSEKLRARWRDASVVASSDCTNLPAGLFLAVAVAAPTRQAARDALLWLRLRASEAYVQECRPRPHSRLALGVPLVDPSIEKVPENAVNWTDRDRISTIVKLKGRRYLWIRRWYKPDREGPREGQRESVLLFTNRPDSAIQLESDCTDPSFAERDGWIALSCTREEAAENLLHETKVYEPTSRKVIFSTKRCRNPRFISAAELTCQAEDVDIYGELHLSLKRLRFR